MYTSYVVVALGICHNSELIISFGLQYEWAVRVGTKRREIFVEVGNVDA